MSTAYQNIYQLSHLHIIFCFELDYKLFFVQFNKYV